MPGNPIKHSPDAQLGRTLVLDELFDLTLYRALRRLSPSDLQKTLDELIEVESNHITFWQEFFNIHPVRLDLGRRIKLWLITLLCRLLGTAAIDLILEAIEVYGIRKYLQLWKRYEDSPVGEAIRGVLNDEFGHEDTIVTRLKERIINPDRVRSIFFGINDGMVEILGAVSGFFASLGENRLVLLAGLTTAAAGSLSMATGAFIATSSANEVKRTQEEKMRFLNQNAPLSESEETALASATTVGIAYFIGASFPLLPVLMGSKTAFASIVAAGTMILVVSGIVAFLSGMNARKRAAINLALISAAVAITYSLGTILRIFWGVTV